MSLFAENKRKHAEVLFTFLKLLLPSLQKVCQVENHPSCRRSRPYSSAGVYITKADYWSSLQP